MTEQKACCGTTCNKQMITEYIDRLESKSVEAMLEHFAPIIKKTKCKVLTIESIENWLKESSSELE